MKIPCIKHFEGQFPQSEDFFTYAKGKTLPLKKGFVSSKPFGQYSLEPWYLGYCRIMWLVTSVINSNSIFIHPCKTIADLTVPLGYDNTLQS